MKNKKLLFAIAMIIYSAVLIGGSLFIVSQIAKNVEAVDNK
jgi:uncharacterized membrane protein